MPEITAPKYIVIDEWVKFLSITANDPDTTRDNPLFVMPAFRRRMWNSYMNVSDWTQRLEDYLKAHQIRYTISDGDFLRWC